MKSTKFFIRVNEQTKVEEIATRNIAVKEDKFNDVRRSTDFQPIHTRGVWVISR